MAARQDPPAIETHGLTRCFGKTPAVNGLNLAVARGEMYGLVGPDGAGKSTTIRVLCGLLAPSGGTARLLGMDLQRETRSIKRHLGYLSQAFTLYGDLTVDENIAFFARIHGVADFPARRERLLEFTRLTPFRRRLAQYLSGGMKKKLALACTLIHTPDLIFLDEPSTGVDPVSRGEFWQILSDLLEQGVTIFMTTPYLEEADRCHRIGLMYQGRLIRDGTPDEVKQAMPGAVYDVACADARAAYRLLREHWSAARLVLYGDRLHVHVGGGEPEIRQAAARLEQHGLAPVTASRVPPTLEDALVALAAGAGDKEQPA